MCAAFMSFMSVLSPMCIWRTLIRYFLYTIHCEVPVVILLWSAAFGYSVIFLLRLSDGKKTRYNLTWDLFTHVKSLRLIKVWMWKEFYIL